MSFSLFKFPRKELVAVFRQAMQQFWAFQNLHFVWLHKFQMAWSFRVLRLLLRLSFDLGCCSFFTLGNSCDKNNGDCEYLCLSILEKQRCFCKEGMKLKENGKNCEEYKLQGMSRLWPVHWISIFLSLLYRMSLNYTYCLLCFVSCKSPRWENSFINRQRSGLCWCFSNSVSQMITEQKRQIDRGGKSASHKSVKGTLLYIPSP